MTHFTTNPTSVRVDRFKRRPSEGFQGKWYDTFALDMSGTEIWDAVTAEQAVFDALVRSGYVVKSRNTDGFFVVVLDPYHRNAYPIMLEV